MLGLWDTEISWVSMCGEGFRETHHSLQGQRQSCDVIYLPESEILLFGSPFLPPAAVCVSVNMHACACVCAHVCSICGVCCRDRFKSVQNLGSSLVQSGAGELG